MRYTDQQLDEINAKTTASKEDNACVVLPLVWDLQDARKEIERVRQLALDIELCHVDALIAIRKEYGEWLYHLGRFGLTSDQHRKDTAVYLRRIANRLNGSATAETLRELSSAVPSSILRDEQPADPPADRSTVVQVEVSALRTALAEIDKVTYEAKNEAENPLAERLWRVAHHALQDSDILSSCGLIEDLADPPVDRQQASIADYEETLADHRRLVRELDVILNGDGAAPQASLVDIVSQFSKPETIGLLRKDREQVRREVLEEAAKSFEQQSGWQETGKYVAAALRRLADSGGSGNG